MTIKIKLVEQYFPVVLFIMLVQLVLSFECGGKILKYDYSKESYCAVWSVFFGQQTIDQRDSLSSSKIG